MVTTNQFYEILIYTLSLLVMLLINCYFYLRTKKLELVKMFFRVQLLIGIWMFARIMRLSVGNVENIWIWIVIQYFGIIFLSIELFAFSYQFKFNRKVTRSWRIGLTGICVLNFLLLFTNEYHHMFFSVVNVSESLKGPFYHWHTFYSYSLISGGIAMLLTSEISPDTSTRFRVILSVGMLMPLAVNVNYVFSDSGLTMDLTPIVFNIMLLSFASVYFRNNYEDMQLMTRIKIMDNLYEGIIILDKDDRVIEYNKRIPEVTGYSFYIEKYHKFDYVFKGFEQFVVNSGDLRAAHDKFVNSTVSIVKVDIKLKNVENVSHLHITFQKTFNSYGERTGSIIKFLDMSEHHSLVDELEVKNQTLREINSTLNENISVKKRLTIEQERNRASKDVHDILGHSITIVISMLEMVKSTYENEPSFAKEKVEQAMEITRKGLSELKHSLTKKKDSSITTEVLINDLEQLIDEFTYSGIEVDFITNHYPIRIKPSYYDTIYRICQESMTNALRHGKASKITIAVRFTEKNVDIIIADNGIGCSNFKKGNGINGMEQRVNELNGFFSCGSPDGEGFNLHVTIPILRDMSSRNVVGFEELVP